MAVVAEKTGYPSEMLEFSMEIEADLGIDSIKRVEIFGALQERLPESPAIKAEHLGTLRTLRQVADFLIGPAATLPVVIAVPTSRVESTLMAVVAEKTGYPAEMLEFSMEIEADLGIDSIKRVEIFGALQERLPESPAIKAEHLGTLRTLRQVADFLIGPATLPAPATVAQPSQVESTLMAVVAEKTGYPAEMLEFSMEIEADLGIDSIKRVEIFGALQERLPGSPAIKAEHLGTLRTLRQVADFLIGSPAQIREATKKTRPIESHELSSPLLTRYVLEVIPIEPDEVVELVEGGEFWISEDGSDLPKALADLLISEGFQTRLITPSEINSLAPGDTSGGAYRDGLQ